MRSLALFCLLLVLGLAPNTLAKTVYTPRDSGTEAPGGPRAPEALPSSGSFGRTAEGGMGYTDAYGNTVSDVRPEPKPRQRLPRGAYGSYGQNPVERPLPDPERDRSPAWSFH